MSEVEGRAGVVSRVEAAVREQYEDTSNFVSRRSMRAYTVGGHTVRERMDALFASFLVPGSTVVDVGCGDGVWASLARSRLEGGRVVALDMAMGMLRDVGARDERVLRVRGDASALPLREGSVDVALACWMLYHVDPARTLPGVARALRPGGCLIATTNDESLLPGLEDDVDAAASEVAGREVHAPLGRLRFNVANGREVLSPYFDEVEEIVDAVDYEMPDASPLITFAKSVRGPVLASLGADFDFDAFLDVMGRRVEARFAGGPIRMTRRSAFFVARA